MPRSGEDLPEDLKLRNLPDSTDLSETIKAFGISARRTQQGVEVPVQPVYMVDPTTNPIVARGRIVLEDETTGSSVYVATAGAPLYNALSASALMYLSNPLTGIHETRRAATRFVTLGLTIAAGDTVAWPLNATKKIRIMGYEIRLASGTTAAAACTLTVKDNATVLFTHAIAGAALAASPVGVVIAQINLPGNGYLCAAVNTPVNVNLSSALAVGGITVNMWGTEE